MTLNELKNKRREVKAKLSKVATLAADVTTSNILHFVLSVFTAGLWLGIWLVCGLISIKQRKSLNKKSVKLTIELDQLEELLDDEMRVMN
jgi:uncharacterized membrane protein YciS (DUF1049 family)|tara:strand:- start:786 stop:1055 length:270 start_codon:yes stop_codon:yes gene_type:complete